MHIRERRRNYAVSVRGDPFITFAERGRGGVKKFDQNANAVREVA